MKNKLLIFIYNKNKDKFLLLSIAKHPNYAVQGGLFTISIEIKKSKYTKDEVIRKIKDKIGLVIKDIFSLNWGSTYERKGEEFKEMNFIAFVNSEKVNLKQKQSKCRWVDIGEFVQKIKWYDDRTLLKKVLIKGINKEAYFDKKERGQ